MDPLFLHQATISWEVSVVEVTREGMLSPLCQGCQMPLNLHQPDENLPSRLLATCGGCGTWFLIEFGSRGTKSLMFGIPGVNLVRAKLREMGRKTGNQHRSQTPTET